MVTRKRNFLVKIGESFDIEECGKVFPTGRRAKAVFGMCLDWEMVPPERQGRRVADRSGEGFGMFPSCRTICWGRCWALKTPKRTNALTL